MMPVKHLTMTVPLKCKTFTFCLAVPRLCICCWSWIKEHHCMTASILQKLLGFYLAIIYSQQLQVVRSRGKKSSIISQGFFTDLNLFFLFFFYLFIFLNKACISCQLHKAYALLWAADCLVSTETSKHSDFDDFWKFKFHFEYFPRNTQFLSFDGPISYLYLFKNHRKAFLWSG